MDRIKELLVFGNRKTHKELKDIFVGLHNSLKDVMMMVKEHKMENKLYSKYEVGGIAKLFPQWCMIDWTEVLEGLGLISNKTL